MHSRYLVYISHVNPVAKARLFTLSSTFTADLPNQWWEGGGRYRTHMRVAHTHCYELLVLPIHVGAFINRVYQSTAIATSGMWT